MGVRARSSATSWPWGASPYERLNAGDWTTADAASAADAALETLLGSVPGRPPDSAAM